ncbi:MAG: hypothetical protein SVW02_03740 [Candidatus Nanohaloarchaea archaeon]|nr:hypothetical protein [Candidatus Nanohaloarchaea archaeon]
MASEFVYVLVAGIAVLVIGGVLAGVTDQTATDQGATVSRPILSTELGTIGTIEATSRTVEFGDTTVEARTRQSEVASRDTVTVGSNVLGASSETVQFEARQGDKLHLSFTPTTSTAKENLIVKVNGERVAVPSYTSGEEVTIKTSDLEEGTNTITFSAEKPGAAFWKAPSYTLEDVTVSVTSPRVIKPFRAFEYEVRGFDRGELRFSITEDVVRDEPLAIKLNGNTVFEQTPVKRALPYTTTFFANTSGLTAGENVLSLSTSGRSSYTLDNLQVTLYFFAGTQRRTVTKDFQITPAEYRKLGSDNGRLTLTVDSVTLQRPVTIELPNATFTRTLNAGNNTFEFGGGDVNRGANTLKISTDGSYRVSELSVSVADN